MKTQQIWDSQHDKYFQSGWINKPSLFALWAKEYFPATGKILELGCGQGQDTRFFAESGYTITGLDYSETGIAYAKEKTQGDLLGRINFIAVDYSAGLSFGDGTFDIVYSHLALHYFPEATTKTLFSEIHRVLKDDGVLVFLVNSVNDPEYGIGKGIERNYFEIRGMKKRFFDTASVETFTKDFTPLILDDRGETFKDRAVGTENLIRFVGKK